jgi:MHS family proline/betaine transporter-like MFS transporter
LREALVDQRGRLLASFGLIILATIAAYTGLFMPAFAIKQLGLPPSTAFLGAFLLGLLQFALAPLFGALSDRVGRFPVMASAAAILLVFIAPGFAFLVAHPTVASLLLVQGGMGIAASAYWGPISAAMAELFPAKIRGTGLSISYSCGVAIFGGFAPFISSWLISSTGTKVAPAFYLMFGAAVSLVALLYSRRKGLR